MTRLWLILMISFACISAQAQQKYIFENRLVYTGQAYTDGLVKRGKYIVYWSFDNPAVAIETFDGEGAFSSLTILDPLHNKIIALDKREYKGFIVPWKMYATNTDTAYTLDSTALTGETQKISQWTSREYKYSFHDGMTADIWIAEALFDSKTLKTLQKANFYFMRLPFGFKGVITKYTLLNKNGNTLANLNLKEMNLSKYYVFDLKKYKLTSY